MSYRFFIMVAATLISLMWVLWGDPDGGAQMMEQIRSLTGLIILVPVVYGVRRAFVDAARGRDLVEWIQQGNTAAGLAYLGLCILTGLLFLAFSPRALAWEPPKDLPILQEEIAARWPSMPMPSMLAALVEQESLWKVRATLKTSREEGVGYGQFTRAYTADGRLRFDSLAEVITMDKSLASWSWADRYNPRMQLRAVVVKNRECYRRYITLAADAYNALAFCDSAYNGGLGGLAQDRRLCAMKEGCNPKVWFKNVELTSAKSDVKWKGYGQSARGINRTHVKNVMVVRRPKYLSVMVA